MNYQIHYVSGTCGRFIQSLVAQFLSCENFVMSEFNKGVPLLVKIDSRVSSNNAHEAPNFELLKSNNLTIIIITIDPSMYGRQSLNMYYKNLFAQEQILSIDEIKKVYLSKIHTSRFIYPFNEYDVISEDIKDKVCLIRLQDIYHNKEKVLEQLSLVTGKPVTKNIIQSYINYLNAQYELMPWYDDQPKK